MGLIKYSLNFLKGRKNAEHEKKKSREWKDNWRKNNAHNHTTISQINLPGTKDINEIVKVGNGTYGYIDLSWFWNENEFLKIGNYCSIAGGVKFLTGGNHYLNRLSSYPFAFYFEMDQKYVTPTKGPIIIEDDVWIGVDSIILSGVTIGQGAVIGAGSVVARDVPPYAIWAGNRIVKYRFSEEIIEKLLCFDYSSISPEDIKNHSELFNSELDSCFFDTAFYKMHKKQNTNKL